MPDLDAIIVPVSGGGMISGIALAAKGLKPGIKIIAAEPSGCPLPPLHTLHSQSFCPGQSTQQQQ